MMIHQFRDKKEIAKRKKLITNIIGTVLLLLIFVSGFIGWSSGFFIKIGWPIWKAKTAITNTLEDGMYIVRTKKSVFNENENLLLENTNLKASMIDYNLIKNENDELKKLLGRIPDSHSYVQGNILAKPNNSPYDTVIIDIGDDVSLIDGQKVYADGLFPIGKISRVYKNNSLVTLYSNPSESTEAMIDGSNASIELLGRGGGNFEMTIPTDLSSEKGTLVFLPGNKSEVLAIVEEIISNPNDPLKRVLLRSPINIQNLKWVQVKKD